MVSEIFIVISWLQCANVLCVQNTCNRKIKPDTVNSSCAVLTGMPVLTMTWHAAMTGTWWAMNSSLESVMTVPKMKGDQRPEERAWWTQEQQQRGMTSMRAAGHNAPRHRLMVHISTVGRGYKYHGTIFGWNAALSNISYAKYYSIQHVATFYHSHMHFRE